RARRRDGVLDLLLAGDGHAADRLAGGGIDRLEGLVGTDGLAVEGVQIGVHELAPLRWLNYVTRDPPASLDVPAETGEGETEQRPARLDQRRMRLPLGPGLGAEAAAGVLAAHDRAAETGE